MGSRKERILSEDSAPAERRISRHLLIDIFFFVLGVLANTILDSLFKKAGLGLKRVWSEVGKRLILPFVIGTLLGLSLWLGTTVDPTTLWNVPPFLHIPHLSLYAQALLANFSTTWTISLMASVVYCCQRYLKRFWWGEGAGELSRRVMIVTLASYVAIVAWFSGTAETSFLIPTWAQGFLWLGSAYPLSTIIFRSAEVLIGRRITGKGGLFSIAVGWFLSSGAVGMTMIGENLYGGYQTFSSRVTRRTLELSPNPNLRPTLIVFLSTVALTSYAISWKLGWTSLNQLSTAISTPFWILIAACVILGIRKLKKDREAEKGIVRVPKPNRSRFEKLFRLGAVIKKPFFRLFSV